ncbi:MAG TPA: hypothetical protein VFO70_10000 [Chitinophagaceae bacterium]|nr:hypothetical protein [Chitinophagaceae bacterium]
MESKWDIYNLIPPTHYPRTIFIAAGSNPSLIIEKILNGNFSFPLIGKPDIGMKGLAVKKLNNQHELIDYALNSRVDFLVQEFIPYRNEVGIFYYRFPNEEKGHISGIVSKEFLEVVGDGEATIQELLQKDKRYILQLTVLKKTFGSALEQVLKKGENFLLPYGNHVRGAKFLDVSHKADDALRDIMDNICSKIDGFYYGRLDIRYHEWDEFLAGKNFSIIELNGAGSEPTHMYDPNHTLFFAWKEIIRHWKILWKISRLNHHSRHRPYMDTRTGLKMLRESADYLRMMESPS